MTGDYFSQALFIEDTVGVEIGNGQNDERPRLPSSFEDESETKNMIVCEIAQPLLVRARTETRGVRKTDPLDIMQGRMREEVQLFYRQSRAREQRLCSHTWKCKLSAAHEVTIASCNNKFFIVMCF